MLRVARVKSDHGIEYDYIKFEVSEAVCLMMPKQLQPVQQTTWNTCSGKAATLYIYNIIVMSHSKNLRKKCSQL